MELNKIMLMAFVAIVVTSLIFRYLVTTNKIKESKISNIFYADDENFIKSWKRTQEKGMLMYILKNIIISSAIWVIMGIISMYGFEQNQTLFVAMSEGALPGVLYGLIFSFGWGEKNKKYGLLVGKRNVESGSINNDDKEI